MKIFAMLTTAYFVHNKIILFKIQQKKKLRQILEKHETAKLATNNQRRLYEIFIFNHSSNSDYLTSFCKSHANIKKLERYNAVILKLI